MKTSLKIAFVLASFTARLVPVVIVVLNMSVLAQAAIVFTSPKGFSITVPDGWSVSSKSKAVDDGEADVEIANQNKLLQIIRVFVAGRMSKIPDPDVEEAMMGKVEWEGLVKTGATNIEVSVSHKTFGKHKALVSDVKWDAPNSFNVRERRWLVYLRAGDHTVGVGCLGFQSDFDALKPVCTKAIESITYPGLEVSSLTDEWYEIPHWARYTTAIGGLLGAIVLTIWIIRVAVVSKKSALKYPRLS